MRNHFRIFLSLFFLLLVFGCKSSFKLSSKTTHVTTVDSTISANPETEKIISPYKEKVQAIMGKVIGKAARDISKEGDKESALGNFMADLQQIKASEYTGKKVDMGIMGGGGIRIPMIPKGNITVGEIFELMPFENELWVLTLKGETVEKLFQYMGNRKTLSISNSQVTFKDKRPVNILIDGKPFDKTKVYTIVISDYMAEGGDGMFFLSEAIGIKKLDKKIRDVIIDYIEDQTKQGKEIDSTVEGRVFKE